MQHTVLITGASSGIGLAIAEWFAQRRHVLILVARSEDKLNELAAGLKDRQGCQVHVFPSDLSQPDAPERLYEALHAARIEPDILINNAGSGSSGLFAASDCQRNQAMIRLNVESLTRLSHLFLQDRLPVGQGRIMNMASTGAYQPGPYTAVYYATKAYVLSLSEALAEELRGTGIRITTVCPGATASQFAQAAGKADLGRAMSAEKVARIACEGLMKGKALVIPGLQNRLAIFLSKGLPGSWTARMVRRIQQPLYEAYIEKQASEKHGNI